MKKIFPKIIDVFCFLGGSVLFTYTIFNFNSNGARNEFFDEVRPAYYYFTQQQRYLLALSVGLIVLGFLIRNWRKGKDKN